MLSALRLRELFSTLRFRLVVWITLVVFLMVLGTSIAVREIYHRHLRNEYDQFLEDSLKEVQFSVEKNYPNDKQQLFSTLEDKVKAFQYRGLFVQLYDSQQRLIWPSTASPALPTSARLAESAAPFNSEKHRILEAKA